MSRLMMDRDDPVNCIVARLERIAAQIEQLRAEVAALDGLDGDIVDLLRRGELLTAAMAADVADRDADTVQRWCRDAEEKGCPLGVQAPSGWLLGRKRFLAYIELERGQHARNVAETRAKKYAGTWSQPLLLKRSKRAE
jgi:hypothetical protein